MSKAMVSSTGLFLCLRRQPRARCPMCKTRRVLIEAQVYSTSAWALAWSDAPGSQVLIELRGCAACLGLR